MEQMAKFRLSVDFESALAFCPIAGFICAIAGLRANNPGYADIGFWIAAVGYAIYGLRTLLGGLGDSSGSAEDVAALWRAGAVLALGVALAVGLRVMFAHRGETPSAGFYLAFAANAVIQVVLLIAAAVFAHPVRRRKLQATAGE